MYDFETLRKLAFRKVHDGFRDCIVAMLSPEVIQCRWKYRYKVGELVLSVLDPKESCLKVNMWLGNYTVIKQWRPVTEYFNKKCFFSP
jgi:hypothetical protein